MPIFIFHYKPLLKVATAIRVLILLGQKTSVFVPQAIDAVFEILVRILFHGFRDVIWKCWQADGRRTDKDAWLYYKLTYEHSDQVG